MDQDQKETKRTLLFLVLALVFLIISASIGGFIFASSAGLKPGSIISKIRSLTLSREKTLQGEDNDRVNILLLGMGGEGHDGATLTDTIILSSIRPSDGKIGLLSIPRDLNILLNNDEYHRINTINAFAEANNPGSGGQATADQVSKILDQPIHYYIRIDFKAFEEIIDTIGGIEVEVEKDFYDPFYPDDNFGYEPVSFKAGKQKMNGSQALKFVRSRHGTNGEGNDFARAKRQQKVLFALKERLLSFDVLLRPKRIKGILDSLEKHLQTNVSFWEGMRFASMIKNVDTKQIQSVVLDASPDGILRERNYNGAFVLEPKDQTWGEVKIVAKELLGEHESSPKSAIEEPKEYPIIEIQNGTAVNGLASKISAQLEAKGFNPVSIGNASVQDVEKTIAYDLAGGKKKDEFNRLVKELNAIEGEGEPMHILRKGDLDFLIILGQDAI